MLDSGRTRSETRGEVPARPGLGGFESSDRGRTAVSISRRWAGVWAVAVGSTIGAGWASAADLVALDGWAGPGVVIAGQGMGPDLIRLTAEGRWSKAAHRDPARYQVRVTLPDGRAETRAFPTASPPPNRRFAVYLPADSVRNRAPGSVKLEVAVVDASTGATVSNDLAAGIAEMPRPKGDVSAVDPGPFGWSRDFEGRGRTLPGSGPDGYRFVRIPATSDAPGFYLASTEATVKQVADRIPGYDPKGGRSDEFALERPEQPAIGLTPAKALEYLANLGRVDPAGLAYRLPTAAEWTRAAKGGRSTAFWWGDGPTFPEGANFLEPEPAQPGDATAPSLPSTRGTAFGDNPFGLYHTFGNVAEWATDASGGHVRMGGHFRTEPANPLPEIPVADAGTTGPDAFVGVRPAFDLSPERGASIAAKRLGVEPALAKVRPAFDPEKAIVTLTGTVAESADRRVADKLLEQVWFLAGVENRIETPGQAPDQVAGLGGALGMIVRRATLDRTVLEVPIAVRWFDPLPVVGSEWWVNIYFPGGQHLAHRLAEGGPTRANKTVVTIDRAKLAELGLADDAPFSVALSLGTPAPNPGDANVVTNVAAIRSPTPTSLR